MYTVYTIGHSTYQPEDFLKLLTSYGINCVIDVRSIPYSKYASNYNKEKLAQFLKANQVQYIFMGKELGARIIDSTLYTKEGFLDFNAVSKTEVFRTGLKRIQDGLSKGFNIAIMCTEKEPFECHRTILVGKALQTQDCTVLHIKEHGIIETHSQLEERLLDRYFPDWRQPSLFSDTHASKDELIREAYQLRNSEIGFRLKAE